MSAYMTSEIRSPSASVRDFLYSFFRDLKAANIQACVLRNYDGLPDTLQSRDIDLLVAEASLPAVLRIICEKKGLKISSVNLRDYIVGLAICLQDEAAVPIHLDLVYKLSWKGLRLFDERAVLLRAEPLQIGSLVYRPSESDEAVISFFSSYFVGGWVNSRYWQVAKIAREDPAKIQALLQEKCGKYTSRAIDALAAKDEKALIALLPRLRLRLITSEFLSQPLISLCYVLRHLKAELSFRVTRKHVVQVVVLGVDGSGKSTLLDSLQSSLSSKVKSIERNHLKPSHGKNRNRPSAIVSDPHGGAPRSAIFSFAKLMWWIASYHFYIRFRWRRNPTLLLWDRYIYDAAVDQRRYRIALPKSTVRALSWLAPRADLLLILNVNSGTAYARKAELTPEILKDLQTGYLELGRSFDADLVATDGAVRESSRIACLKVIDCLDRKNRQLLADVYGIYVSRPVASRTDGLG